MNDTNRCGDCNGFGYTKGGPAGPWEKLDCERCSGSGQLRPTTRVVKEPRGVTFYIGNQGFTLAHTEADQTDPDAGDNRDFMADMLTRALGRLTTVITEDKP